MDLDHCHDLKLMSKYSRKNFDKTRFSFVWQQMLSEDRHARRPAQVGTSLVAPGHATTKQVKKMERISLLSFLDIVKCEKKLEDKKQFDKNGFRI